VRESSDRLFWRVLANAATKPLNVLALAVMSAVAILTDPLVFLAAVPVYGLLVAATIRDPKEAARLAGVADRATLPGHARSLEGITGGLRGQVIAAINEERGITAELARSTVAPEGVAEEVATLCDEVLDAARRASDVDLYLVTVDVDGLRVRSRTATGETASAIGEQLSVVEDLIGRRDALADEIDHVAAALGTIRARLVQTRATTTASEPVTGDVTALRERMRVLAESLGEVYGHNQDNPMTKGT
jgi:hypothetical protein